MVVFSLPPIEPMGLIPESRSGIYTGSIRKSKAVSPPPPPLYDVFTCSVGQHKVNAVCVNFVGVLWCRQMKTSKQLVSSSVSAARNQNSTSLS